MQRVFKKETGVFPGFTSLIRRAQRFLPLGVSYVTIFPTGAPIIDNCDIGLGPFCWLSQMTDPQKAFKAFATAISNTIGFLTVAAGLWFMMQLFVGAFGWMSSGGDKAQLEAARNRITHAVTGLIIVVAAIAIIGVLGEFLGLDILINPGKLVCQLNPLRDPATICH